MISEYIIDETLIKVGSDYIWLWVAMEAKKQADARTFVKIHRKKHVHSREIYFELGQDSRKKFPFHRWWNRVPLTRHVDLNHDHRIHPHYEESLIEITMNYIKDRTECFDDYFPCRKKKNVL
jgi:transposase-like protein